MPELPEVEVVRRGLESHVPGRRIAAVTVTHARSVRRHLAGPADFELALIGRTLDVPRRRGKYLWLPFVDGDAILAHLGMSGQFRIDDDAAQHRHARVNFTFDDDACLTFCDQRTFGGLSLSGGGAALPNEIAHIAMDPFEAGWNARQVAARITGRRTVIKRALLDQGVVSGVGNIYADEALWVAQVHPETPTDTMDVARIERVLVAARDVMAAALAVGGTSFDALYVNVNGESGYFSRALSVYGREGEPCKRCDALIVRERFMNRSSHFCPRCQRRTRR